jgi:ribosomal-protein-alanine acetyltransferase
MTEHDLLEVVEVEKDSGLSVWGWDAYHKELQSPEDVIMLVARTEPETEQAATDPNHERAVAGFIVSRVVAGELHVNNVAVRPEFRRQGLAARLLEAVLTQGRRSGAKIAFLEVRAGNVAAQGLYRRCGFQVTGRRRRYYREPAEDALLMSLLMETSPWFAAGDWVTFRPWRIAAGISHRKHFLSNHTNREENTDMEMRTADSLKDELMTSNSEFRELAREHGRYEERLSELSALAYPSDEEQLEEVTLKKKKLAIKDQMYSLMAQHQKTASTH